MAKIRYYDPAASLNSIQALLSRWGLRDADHFQTPGNIFYVNSAAVAADGTTTTCYDAADGYHGQSWTYPFATLAYAVTQCTSGNADLILIAPTHAETITASDLALDKEDLMIIGTGRGNIRPVFTFSAAGSTIAITKKCYAYGLCMKAAASTTVTALLTVDVAATGTVFAGMTKDVTAESAVITANIAAGDTTYATFGTSIYGSDADSLASDIADVQTEVDKIGTPAGASVSADIAAIKAETAVIKAQEAGTVGIAAFPAAAAAANDVSLAEVIRYIQENGPDLDTTVGTTFWVKKTLTSSAIVQAGVDVTAASSGGELYIEDVLLKTDGTGLATGTNVSIYTDNAKGLVNVLTEAVSNLGANKTINLSNASVTKIATVLESGKKIKALSTAANCTGGGTVDVYIKLRRLTKGATVAAA